MDNKTEISREIEIFSNGLIKFDIGIEKNRIISIKPIIGFHHRGIEKLCENQNCNKALELISRIDSENPYIYPTAVAIAYERLNQIVVPEKVEYSRVLAIELLRIKNHLQMLYNLFGAIRLSNFIDEIENKLITVETIISSLFLISGSVVMTTRPTFIRCNSSRRVSFFSARSRFSALTML